MSDLAGPPGRQIPRASRRARGAGRHVARRSRRVLVPLTLGLGLALLLTAAGVDGSGSAGNAPGVAASPTVSLWGAAAAGALMLLVAAAVVLLLVPTRRGLARGGPRGRASERQP